MPVLEAKNLTLAYAKKPVIHDANISIRSGEIISIIGPNGSGKSTLLKALCRLMRPVQGQTLLFGEDIWKLPTKKVAQVLAILPQVKHIHSDVTVRQLVGFGRFPHSRFARPLDKKDEEIIEEAIYSVRLQDHIDRFIGHLSGGEQQRAWIAMALAQLPKIMILDEPTTFLDISHQLEIMEMLCRLNRDKDMTIIMVLHDVNQAVRFSDKICALKEGQIVAFEKADEIITEERIRELFGIEVNIYQDIHNARPFFIPHRSLSQKEGS